MLVIDHVVIAADDLDAAARALEASQRCPSSSSGEPEPRCPAAIMSRIVAATSSSRASSSAAMRNISRPGSARTISRSP